MTAGAISFKVLNRFTGAIQFTAKIKCAADELPSVKLGLAVKWARATRADLSGADLSGADLSGANLCRADLSGADLSGADLSGANLCRADLSGANLYGADLCGANLYGADLCGANLCRADLSGADLSGADLSGANLYGADLCGKKLSALVARATRNDGYEFFLWRFEDDSHVIIAGCRTFTIDEFRAHVATQYPDTAKARETLAILAFLEARLADTEPVAEIAARRA